jgi:hypothetical protein
MKEYTKTNPTLALEEERKKTLQEAIKNLPKGDTFSNPTVLPNDYVKRMENERANLIKAQQELTKSSTPSTSKLFGAYNKNLILVVLAVAGYFAYKKFKK